jgi:hypothetical protein
MKGFVRALAALLQIPALLIVESLATVHLVALAGLGAIVPAGVHTYLPIAEAIPLATLAGAAVPLSALGLAVLLVDARRRSYRDWATIFRPGRRRLMRGLALVVFVQLAGYLLQVAYVDQVQGVADAAAVLAVAAALQVALIACLFGLAGLVGAVPPALRTLKIAIGCDFHAPPRATCSARPAITTGDPVACAPRRGPPLALLIPINA